MKTLFLTLTMTILVLLTTVTCYAVNTNNKKNIPLQNTSAAVDFFEKELNFRTNPHGLNKVVTGEVKNVVIVDVRSAKDFEKGHVPGAINIPY